MGYGDGPVLATYIHGMFEAPEVLQALSESRSGPGRGDIFDELADAVEANIDMRAIEQLVALD